MKISVDDKELFVLSDTQKNVIKDYVSSDIFEEDMKRRITWVINEIYKEAFKRLKAKWEPKLAKSGVDSIPTDKDKFAELVFKQDDYKDRATRESQAKGV